jgi:hypothetical protein
VLLPYKRIQRVNAMAIAPLPTESKASAVDAPAETGVLHRHCKPVSHSSADAGPSRGMRIVLRAERIAVDDCSRLE